MWWYSRYAYVFSILLFVASVCCQEDNVSNNSSNVPDDDQFLEMIGDTDENYDVNRDIDFLNRKKRFTSDYYYSKSKNPSGLFNKLSPGGPQPPVYNPSKKLVIPNPFYEKASKFNPVNPYYPAPQPMPYYPPSPFFTPRNNPVPSQPEIAKGPIYRADLPNSRNMASKTPSFEISVELINSGTKWCSAYFKPQNNYDFALFNNTDVCCRNYVHCTKKNPSDIFKYIQTQDIEVVHDCDCDEDFRTCLQRTNTLFSNLVGSLYFLPDKRCFKYDYHRECIKFESTSTNEQKCVEYKSDTPKEKTWEIMDLEPFF